MNRRQFLKRSSASLLIGGAVPFLQGCTPQAREALTSHYYDLANLINDVRESNGLNRIPISSKLSMVALWHCADLEQRETQAWRSENPVSRNLHSWSPYPLGQKSDGGPLWQSVEGWVIGVNNRMPHSMFGYAGDGFEISHQSTNETAQEAVHGVHGWLNSDCHRAVMLNQSCRDPVTGREIDWSGYTWRGLGAVFSQHFAHAWFGTSAD